jgi:tetratricopeptide (TPR) repeat protein
MRQMLMSMILLCLFTAPGAIAHAAGAGEQDFTKGESLLKNKNYAEARAALEAGLLKDPSNIPAHFNLAEACRALEAWACAEEHYETALELDAKSGPTKSYLPKTKAKVWRLREVMTVWRLLNEAKDLLAGGKLKQAEESLHSADELGLNNEQQPLYQQLQAKLPLPHPEIWHLRDREEGWRRLTRWICRWCWCRPGSSRGEAIAERTKSL